PDQHEPHYTQPPLQSTLSPCTLFFPSYRDLLHLPSFPTRRSSDLASATRQARTGSRNNDEPPEVLTTLGTGQPMLMSMMSAARRDRKSTRLNSSHVAISYAVFCLKKKKR